MPPASPTLIEVDRDLVESLRLAVGRLARRLRQQNEGEITASQFFVLNTIAHYGPITLGQLVSVSGTWMQQLAQDWLVLRLTNRSLPVGITTALQFAPVLVLGIWGGLIADRVDKRRLLLATQGAMGALALALGVLTATGAVRLWMIYLLAVLLGCATSFDMPARQSF